MSVTSHLLIKNGKPIPLADTVTELLPEECWVDIPDFDGLYQISNYGRVRSIARWVERKTGPDYFRKGRIIKLLINLHVPKNNPSNSIQMKLHRNGNRYQFSVARYVYHLFVAPFDLSDHSLIIRRHDNDLLNCFYKNLYLVSISDVALEGFAANTRRSSFQDQIKPVSQYSLEGVFIQTFASAKLAGQAVGAPNRYINDAAKREARPAANCYWRYGKPRATIDVSKLQSRLLHRQHFKTRKVEQLSLAGKPLKIYDSINQARIAMKASSCTNISYVCKGKLHSSKGYKWRYVE
jgi:NUMOD4 motif